MSEVGDAINEARAEIAAAAAEFMPDLCDLGTLSKTIQGDGHTIADNWIATNIPCKHEQISGGGVQVNDNGTTVTKTHRITLPYTAATKLINRQYKIRVQANGFNPQAVFEQPVQQLSWKSPLLEVVAVLSEGYRRPGTA